MSEINYLDIFRKISDSKNLTNEYKNILYSCIIPKFNSEDIIKLYYMNDVNTLTNTLKYIINTQTKNDMTILIMMILINKILTLNYYMWGKNELENDIIYNSNIYDILGENEDLSEDELKINVLSLLILQILLLSMNNDELD